jgi:hypothetical protein
MTEWRRKDLQRYFIIIILAGLTLLFTGCSAHTVEDVMVFVTPPAAFVVCVLSFI